MKCSLLTLSTFIDGELAPPRHAEVDAHLVGCTRCSAGAATLREEKARVGQLARVTVDPGSAQLMLEQVGITLDSVVDRSPIIPPPPSLPTDVQRPWQGGQSSRALPWTPRRPEPATPIVRDHAALPSPPPVTLGAQPDLPLDGVRSAPASWDRVNEPDAPTAIQPPPVPLTDTGWVEADEEWLTGGIAPDSWEEDLPPTAPPAPAPVSSWNHPEVAAAPLIEPLPPPLPTGPVQAPPTRLAAASGPAALWTRVRDAVSVRLALARGGDALEESLQILSGAPPPRRIELPPEPARATPDDLAYGAAAPVAAPPEPSRDVELNGVPGHLRPAPATDVSPRPVEAHDPIADWRARPAADVVDHGAGGPAAGGAWNAFAASSYAMDSEVHVDDAPTSARPRPIGRHTRAVARERVPLSARLSSGVTALAGATRAGAGAAVARVRQSAGSISRTGPDSRLLAGIAGIGLIFVIALIIGHGSGHPVVPTAARPSTAATATRPSPTTPAKSSSAASAASAPAGTQVQAFGAGGTGFQVIRLRYGAQTGYMRVVFDLGAASGAATGTPRATVSFSSPTTALVTFNGTLPAGSTGTPIPGKVISSVTLVSSSGGTTVYSFGLTRPATATAFYLVSPTRFVLDLH